MSRTASYYDASFKPGKPVGKAMLEHFWNIRSKTNEANYNALLKQLDPAGLRKERQALFEERRLLEESRANILAGTEEQRLQAIDNFNKNRVDVFKSRATLTGKRIEVGQRGYTAEKKREAESRAARAISPDTRQLLYEKFEKAKDSSDRGKLIIEAFNAALERERGVLGGGSVDLEKFDTLLLEAISALHKDEKMQIAVMQAVRPNQRAWVLDENGERKPVNFAREYMERYGVESDTWLQQQAYKHYQRYGVGDPSLMAPTVAGAPIGQNALASINDAIADVEAEMKGLKRLEGRSREEYERMLKEGFDPLAPIRRKAWEGEAMIDRVARLQEIDPDRAEGQFEAARARYEGKGVPASPLVRSIEQRIRTSRGEEIEMPEVFQGVGPAGNIVDYIQTETAAIQGLLEGDEDQKRQALERAWGLNDTISNPLIRGQVEAVGFLNLEGGERITIADEQSGLAGYMREAQNAMKGGDVTAMYEWIAAGINDVQGAVSTNIQDNPELHRVSSLSNTYKEAIRGALESGQDEDYDAYGQQLAGIKHSLNALPEELRGEAGTAISEEIGRMEDFGDRRYMEASLNNIVGGLGPYRGYPSAPRQELVEMDEEPPPTEALEPPAGTPAEVATDPYAPKLSGTPREAPDIKLEPKEPSAAPEDHRPPPATFDPIKPDDSPPELIKDPTPSRSKSGPTAYEIAGTTPGDVKEDKKGRAQAEEQRRQEILRKGGGGLPGPNDPTWPGRFGDEFQFLDTPPPGTPAPTGRKKRGKDILEYRATIPTSPPESAPSSRIIQSWPRGMDPIQPPILSPAGKNVANEGRDRYGGEYQEVHRRDTQDSGLVYSTRWYPKELEALQYVIRQNPQTGEIVDIREVQRAGGWAGAGPRKRKMYQDMVATVRIGQR